MEPAFLPSLGFFLFLDGIWMIYIMGGIGWEGRAADANGPRRLVSRVTAGFVKCKSLFRGDS
ncbi:hypothetical protein LZ32DRAFT_27137 [Colletotrichum eremochloae]|nr:hypothetical protein LZ32DRAFT_27137 [Colletotrichum eremochloae]